MRPAIGLHAWIVTDGKAGDRNQCLGIAKGLDAEVNEKKIDYDGGASHFPNLISLPDKLRPTSPDSPISGPFPDIVIGSGRRAVPYLRALTKMNGVRPFTVFIKNPRVGLKIADLIWVPSHDQLRGPNVIASETGPHSIDDKLLSQFKTNARPSIQQLPGPKVALLIGGNSSTVCYDLKEVDRLMTRLRPIIRQAGSLMITTSRRTPLILRQALMGLKAHLPTCIFNGSGKSNPYLDILAHADCFIVTGDSHNMVSEATVTGKPIHVFRPKGLAPKFHQFLNGLTQKAIVFDLGEKLHLETYQPINVTPEICQEILRRMSPIE